MKTIFLVYATDKGHSKASQDLIGCATNLGNAVEIVKAEARNLSEPLTEYDIGNLQHINQTQGYSGDYEFVIKEVNTNELFF